ncbi:peptidase M28 [Lewinellaceae bacterium SD302]|nr:peptidase M28 [Lewinellaceae bacterium SD302]
MRYQLYFLVLLGYFASPNTNAAQYFTPPDTQQVMIDVTFLSADLLEGRLTATPGEALAADYISARMQQLNLEPQPNHGTFVQTFEFDYKDNPHAAETRKLVGKNVAGFLDNGAKQTVVIGAHYDHLGYGGIGSLHAGEPAIHNGADDNASGIAAMLYLADKLQMKGAPKKRNYLFIAFSGEELGLVGSKRWVAADREGLEIAAMLNMDMVGRLRNKDNVLAIYGFGTSAAWAAALDASEKMSDITSVRDSSGVGPSDHTSFYLDEIPVLAAFTGQHGEYHKPGDDAHLVDFTGIIKVADYLYGVLESINGEKELVFLKTRQREQRQAAAFKVSLGVMPDYVYAGEGMKVDGVTEGRPGFKAGMQAGDVIVKMGDLEVKDIYDYMEGLSKNKAGDTTTVVVDRKGELIELEVTF